ncbi:transposase [Streptomyces sp. NPDC001135]
MPKCEVGVRLARRVAVTTAVVTSSYADGDAHGDGGGQRGVEDRAALIWSRRQLIDGIRFRGRAGIPWRDMPEEYGPWGRAYDLFRHWQRNGTWQRILQKPVSIVVTAGQCGDSPQIEEALGRVRVPGLGPGRGSSRTCRSPLLLQATPQITMRDMIFYRIPVH